MIRRLRTRHWGYIGAAVVCCLILWTLYGLWHVDLRFPIVSLGGDALVNQALIFKALVDNPWYWDNSRLGAPFGLNLRDFPLPDLAVLGSIKLLTVFTKNHNLIRNLVVLGGFPLITLTSLYAMQRLGVRYIIALTLSLLYAFSSYHHMRLAPHALLAFSYFTVPILTLLAIPLFENRPIFVTTRLSWPKAAFQNFRDGWRAIAACVVIGATGMVYYPFFSCYLLLVAGVVAAARSRSTLPFVRSLCLVGVIGTTLALSLAPTIVQNLTHGSNAITERSPQEAEVYGLKIAQLIIPGAGHRIEYLKHLGDYYNSIAPLVGENQTAYLGLVGVVGFLYLIFVALGGPVSDVRIRTLSYLNLAAVLLGTIGGFSSIFAFLVSPTIRSYNRICVYIGFFSLLSLALVAEKAAARWISTFAGRLVLGAGLAAVLWFGVYDQYAMESNYDQPKREYLEADAFIAKIEQSVPPNSAIYQFPYFPFSERRDYSLFTPYLHSKTLRWSFGSVLGRRGDIWHSRIAALPEERAIEVIALAGFAGAYVAREQIPDRGASLEAKLQSLLGGPQVVSATGHAAFYSFREYTEKLTKSLGQKEFERRQSDLLNWTYLGWRDGFYPAESHNGLVDVWGKNHSRFLIENPSSMTRKVVFRAKVRAKDAPAMVSIVGDGFQKSFDVGPTGYLLSEQFEVKPGKHFFHVKLNAPRANSNIFTRSHPLGFEDAVLETIQQ